jgi:hypothetical protein
VLISENGPWTSPDGTRITRFKLDKPIFTSFKPNKLVPNYRFNDHKDASLLRSGGNIHKPISEYQEHLKKLQLTEIGG